MGTILQEPGPESAPAVEVVQVAQGLEEAVLDGVLGVLLVAEQAVGHAIGDPGVPAEQFLPRGGIPLAGQADQDLIGRQHVGLCLGHSRTFPCQSSAQRCRPHHSGRRGQSRYSIVGERRSSSGSSAVGASDLPR